MSHERADKACDACGSPECPDKHLCDVKIPPYACPSGRDPERARKQSERVAFPRESTGRKPPPPPAPKWSPEQVETVVRLKAQGRLSLAQIGLQAGLDTEAKKAKNAAAGILRRIPQEA